jgi:hypothetical protein
VPGDHSYILGFDVLGVGWVKPNPIPRQVTIRCELNKAASPQKHPARGWKKNEVMARLMMVQAKGGAVMTR